MSNVQFLRAFVNQRLTLAAEEIFGLFERTIAEYEEKLQRSEENQQKLLDSFYNPKVLLHRAEVQEPVVQQEEAPHEQQERSSGLNQESQTEVSIIKIEEDELWVQPQGLMEGSIFMPAAVKIEEEEKLQSSQLHENPAEEDRDTFQPQESDSDDSACDGEISESQSGSEESASDTGSDTGNTSASSSEEATDQERHLLYYCGQDKGSEPVDCSLCKHRRTSNLKQRPFKCSICNQTFNQMAALTRHARVHTSETSFSCAFCGLKFALQRTLQQHIAIHTGEKPHSCSVCGLKFALHGALKRHMLVHQGEKPFSCSVCGNKFTLIGSLKRHMATAHLDEKLFMCQICGNTFTQSWRLKRHMVVHKDEKPYSCSMCDKSFAESHSLRMHMAVHRQ
ncbi:zinc finger protein OZF-like [Cheilinus undulatus]|uniref:zinc finger protein OZF-like n=1 Tax=Cheilinus undulatus TaxID=241271 RepID=UPI001BD22482|nr:zinc finger protein OZF-like [Cheilinus undulatus]